MNLLVIMQRMLEMEGIINEHTQKAVQLHDSLKRHQNEKIRKMVNTDTPEAYAFRVRFEVPIQYSIMDYDDNDDEIEKNEAISAISISYPPDAGGDIEIMLINSDNRLVNESLNRFGTIDELVTELLRLQT